MEVLIKYNLEIDPYDNVVSLNEQVKTKQHYSASSGEVVLTFRKVVCRLYVNDVDDEVFVTARFDEFKKKTYPDFDWAVLLDELAVAFAALKYKHLIIVDAKKNNKEEFIKLGYSKHKYNQVKKAL